PTPEHVIAKIEKDVIGSTSRQSERLAALDWRTSPFMFQALKLAIVQLLDYLTPDGPIESPFEKIRPSPAVPVPLLYRSPEALADAAATFVWLHFTNPLNDGELEYVKNSEHGSDLERMHYGMATAWRALYPGKARDFYIIGSEPKYQTAKELKSTAKMW